MVISRYASAEDLMHTHSQQNRISTNQHSHQQCNAPRAYRSKSKARAVDKYKSKTVPNTWQHSLYNPKSNNRIYRSGAIKSISPSVSGRSRATPASEKVLWIVKSRKIWGARSYETQI